MGDLLNQSLERKFPDKKFSRFLVSPDLSGGNGTGSESVGLLDTSGGGGTLLSGLAVELFPWLLDAVGRFSSGGFGSGHSEEYNKMGFIAGFILDIGWWGFIGCLKRQ